jgi:PAS domain S-box-containing protein
MLHDYQVWQRDYLLRISRAMTSQLDLQAVLRLILEGATELVGGQAGLIALMQPDGSYKLHASYGVPENVLPLFSPLFADIPDSGQHLDPLQWTIPDLERRLSRIVGQIGIAMRQIVALPMTVQGNQVGVIYVIRREGTAFTLADRRALSSFAGQAAIAVHNARLYQQVTREKQRLDAIIENSGDGVMILDAEEKISVYNRALTIMTGIPAEETIGKYCWQVLHLRDQHSDQEMPEMVRPLARCVKGERFYVEGDYVRDDSIRITMGITYTPLFDTEGQLVNMIANVRDITRFRKPRR